MKEIQITSKSMKERCIQMIRSKYFKIFIGMLVLLFILRESYAIYIDMYNFRQLDKVKVVLDNSGDIQEFKGLNDFNKKYNQTITPIKGCYVIRKSNGDEPYIFGFKLESLLYMYIYGDKQDKKLYNKEYYSYPKYDIPEMQVCTGICYDLIRIYFEDFIFHSCGSRETETLRENFGE